jgi:8-oxo-dGTP pyrophosphatase MutT (NUDIX family)
MTDANDIKSNPIVFLPGGHIKPGESAQGALKREFKEELDIDVRVGDFIGCFEHSLPSGHYCHDFEIGLLFFVDCPPKLIQAEWRPIDQPTIQIGWLSIAELNKQQIKPPGLWQAIQPVLKSSSAHQPFFLSTYPD